MVPFALITAARHSASALGRRALVLCVLALPVPLPVLADGRVALLIGNGGYSTEAFALPNPANDVRAMEGALTRLGFEVRAEIDLSRDAMRTSLAWFREAAAGAEIAMVFYAGHAVQVGSENFLIGTDLAELSAPALIDASLTLSELVDATEDIGADLSMIILDACRNNPFDEAGLGQAGLSPVSGGVGTLVAYATDPGNVAADGLGTNSTFTEALIAHIETPGLDVRLMMGRVRQQVVAQSGGQQVPWVEEAVLGEHYLAAAPAPLDPTDELAVWRDAVRAETEASYTRYLEQFPTGLYALVAELRIDALNGTAPEAADLADADIAPAAAALQLLGYIVPGAAAPVPSITRQAFARWRSDQPTGTGGFPALMEEAARKATFVGTYTAGILKNDLRRYASIEETLRSAERSLATAEARYASDTASRPRLAAMRADVARIAEISQGIATDLDASRTYYDDLIALTDRYLTGWLSVEQQPRFASSRGITRLSDRAISDAQTFYAHLELVREAPDGSYAWLASMMKGL
ncbi:MAG: caspase family protein [Pseudomonadota bacterium]